MILDIVYHIKYVLTNMNSKTSKPGHILIF